MTMTHPEFETHLDEALQLVTTEQEKIN